MTSLKQGYLHTNITEKGESVKMSTRNDMYSDEEEENMVAQVGGRGRSLVRVLIRIRRERERAGRALQNLQMTPDLGTRPRLQEVGPCGWEIDRRLGGLQTWGRTNQTADTPDRQQTAPRERPRMKVRARARPSIPPPTPRLPYSNLSPVGCFMAPTDACTVTISQTTFYHCLLTPSMTLTPHHIMKTYFPQTIPHSLTQTPPHDL